MSLLSHQPEGSGFFRGPLRRSEPSSPRDHLRAQPSTKEESRFEDLYRDCAPAAVLIRDVPHDQLKLAMNRCDLDPGVAGRFLKLGSVILNPSPSTEMELGRQAAIISSQLLHMKREPPLRLAIEDVLSLGLPTGAPMPDNRVLHVDGLIPGMTIDVRCSPNRGTGPAAEPLAQVFARWTETPVTPLLPEQVAARWQVLSSLPIACQLNECRGDLELLSLELDPLLTRSASQALVPAPLFQFSGNVSGSEFLLLLALNLAPSQGAASSAVSSPNGVFGDLSIPRVKANRLNVILNPRPSSFQHKPVPDSDAATTAATILDSAFSLAGFPLEQMTYGLLSRTVSDNILLRDSVLRLIAGQRLFDMRRTFKVTSGGNDIINDPLVSYKFQSYPSGVDLAMRTGTTPSSSLTCFQLPAAHSAEFSALRNSTSPFARQIEDFVTAHLGYHPLVMSFEDAPDDFVMNLLATQPFANCKAVQLKPDHNQSSETWIAIQRHQLD